jgi:hypothetical protein
LLTWITEPLLRVHKKTQIPISKSQFSNSKVNTKHQHAKAIEAWIYVSDFAFRREIQAGERSLRMFLKIPKKNTSGKGGYGIVFTPMPVDWYV